MHLLLCNERFLFRYGVDRVLLILTKYLRDKGHFVTVMGITMDRKVAQTVADHTVCIPPTEDYYNLNEYVEAWLKANWDDVFSKVGTPDLVLNCGWPFFTAIPYMSQKTKGVIFHDYGIVPVYEYENGTLKIQEKVRALRKEYMKYCTSVITISDYVTKTTYEILPEDQIPVRTIHLGANHMELNVWNKDSLQLQITTDGVAKIFTQLRQKHKKIILNLGRWESAGYKNSRVMFPILRELKKKNPQVVLVVLTEPKNIEIPEDLTEQVIPLGFISDEELIYSMREADLGIAPTLWEGFDLPLAEMQYYRKPVLVFHVGAHPEVVLHPWYLCNDGEEMICKADKILNGQDLPQWIREDAYNRFVNYFTWERCARKCFEVFCRVLSNDQYKIALDEEYKKNAVKTVTVVMDMTNPSRDPANPGIIRVCRRLAAHLQQYIDPVFVVWSEPDKEFVLPTRHECEVMGTYHGPLLLDELKLSPDSHRILLHEYMENKTAKNNKWLLLPDTVFPDRNFYIYDYCKKRGYRLADIFYDDIPFKLDEIYDKETKRNHAHYMLRLSDSDFVSSISEYSTECLMDFYRKAGVRSSNVKTIELPGELTPIPRASVYKKIESKCVQFVCVSTLEPRKNHKVLMDACLLLEKKHPELNFKLVMIGNRYQGHFDIADYAEKISKQSDKIQWIGIASDEVMRKVVEESAFTVYCSRMEGYGLPIMESIWQGKPCLCSGEGAMGELAKGGGCCTTDVNDSAALCDSLYTMCTDTELIEKLTVEAINRKIISWDDYTLNTLQELLIRENELAGIPQMDCMFSEEKRYDPCGADQAFLYLYLKESSPFCSMICGCDDSALIQLIASLSALTILVNCPDEIQGSQNVHNLISINGQEQEVYRRAGTISASYRKKVDFIYVDGKSVRNAEIRLLVSRIEKGALLYLNHRNSIDFEEELQRFSQLYHDDGRAVYICREEHTGGIHV